MLCAAEYLHASLDALTKQRSAGKRTKYDESAAGICRATARIAHVGAPRMLQRLARFKLPETCRSARRGSLSELYHVLHSVSSEMKSVSSSPRKVLHLKEGKRTTGWKKIQFIIRSFVAALPNSPRPRPAPATAALLNASGSEDSHRGPDQQA
jgi:hypothetical protein